MARDIEGQLREYAGLVESLAEKLSRRDRNEYDDLYQEGMIACWEFLRAGKLVTEEGVEKRMTKWLRYRNRQRRDVTADYNKLLTIPDAAG